MSDYKTAAEAPDRTWTAAFLLLAALFSVLVFLDAGADPPLGPSDLEGQILIGAREGGGGAPLPLGDWSPSAISPTQVFLTRALFRLTGPGLAAGRAVAGFAAILSVLLFYALVREAGGPRLALVAAAILMTNPVFFGVSRMAIPAPFSILWMLVVLRLWTWGARRGFWALCSGGIVVWAALFENAPRNAFFLGAGVFLALVIRLHAWKMPWLGTVRHRLGLFWLGGGAAAALFVLSVVSRWEEHGATWGHFVTGSWHILAANALVAPVYLSGVATLMPVATVLGVGYFLFFARDLVRPVARHRRLDEIRLGFLGWLLCGTVYFVLLAAQPLDGLALLLPPISLLAADALRALGTLRRFSRPRIDVMIVMLLIAGCTWLVVAWGVHRFYGSLPLPGSWQAHQIRGSFALIALLWLLVTSIVGWLYLRWRKFTWPLPPRIVMTLTLLLGLGIPVQGIWQTAGWWASRRHDVLEASERLHALPAGSLVIGSWAPLLTLGSPAGASVVLRGVNDAPRTWHAEITHLLLDTRGEAGADAPTRLVVAATGRGVVPVPGVPIRIGRRILMLHEVVNPGRLP